MSTPVVLITGALSGIGRATAAAFAKNGASVVASGRREAEGKALEAELRNLGADAVFIRADVRREDDVRGLIQDRARLALGACGVDGGVDPAEACDGLVDQAAYVVLAAHIGTDESRLGTEAAELGFQRLAFSFPAARRDDGCAIFGKNCSGGAANAGQRAGDQHDGGAHSRSS